MMERAEKAGLGIALIGHAALFAALSLRLLTPPLPVPPPQQVIEVSLAPDVALQQASPAPAPPAPSEAPEQGAPEEEAVVEPTPAPKPAPAPAKPKPSPDRAISADVARADAERAAKAAASAARAEKANAASAAKAAAASAAAAKAEAARAAAAARPRGSRLGKDFLKGLADTPSKAESSAAPGAVMNAKVMADIGSAILRQVQPCADRQVIPGPGAERIRVSINLRLNRDGSLAASPRVVNHDGIDDDNRRYLDRVDDLAIATFTGCSPLRGLPANLYDIPNGWRSFTLRFNLRG